MKLTPEDEVTTRSTMSANMFGVALIVSLIVVVGFMLWVWISNDKTRNNKGNKEKSSSDGLIADGNASISKPSANSDVMQVDPTKAEQVQADVLSCNEAKIPDNSRTTSRVAQPGFYVALKDNRGKVEIYAESFEDRSSAFRKNGFSAFYGRFTATAGDPSPDMEFVERSNSAPLGWGTIFVGPFQSDVAARDRLPKIISILKRQIRKGNTVGIEGDDPMLVHSYLAKIVRVKTNRVIGTLANLVSADYTIRPGGGVGRILIGIGPCEVLSLLGRPRDSGVSSDFWWWSEPGKEEGLGVRFRDGLISEIEVTDPKFHTVAGLRPGTQTQSFRKAFPTTEGYSCGGGGSGGFSTEMIVDAVRNGIVASYSEDSDQIEALTVYRVSERLSQDKSGQCEKIW